MSVEEMTHTAPVSSRAESTPATSESSDRGAGRRYSLHLDNMAEILAQAVEHHPDKEALFDDAGSFTFAEMENASRHFAAFLVSKGVATGSRIAFCEPKSAPLVVAILGCLKAGAIYVPVDSKVPKSRILLILEDVAPSFIVASRGLHERLFADSDSPLELIATEDLRQCFEFSGPAALPVIDAEDVAYCLYTSGSTGRPKGVLIEHGSVCAFFRALAEIMTQDADSRCMNTSELYFDVHVMDLFFPLFRGASVHLSCGPLIANRLLATIEEQRITHFTAVGPVMTLMTQGSRFEDSDLSSLVRVMTGAEIIHVDTMQRWLRKVPGLSLVNGYGPTEATVICTAFIIDRAEPGRSELYPIGKPMQGTDVLLRDEGRILTQPGQEGELLIGGPQVMKGYWNN